MVEQGGTQWCNSMHIYGKGGTEGTSSCPTGRSCRRPAASPADPAPDRSSLAAVASPASNSSMAPLSKGAWDGLPPELVQLAASKADDESR